MYVDPYGFVAILVFTVVMGYLGGVAMGWKAGAYRSKKAFTQRLSMMKDNRQLLDSEFDVLAERRRQIYAEYHWPSDDDKYLLGQLASAAACYAANAASLAGNLKKFQFPGENWPWDKRHWKPSTPRHDLVKAGALILAEIDRLDRAALKSSKEANHA